MSVVYVCIWITLNQEPSGAITGDTTALISIFFFLNIQTDPSYLELNFSSLLRSMRALFFKIVGLQRFQLNFNA